MNRLKRDIATVLMGIFFFPIIFQSVHVVWHLAFDPGRHPGLTCCTDHEPESCNDASSLSQDEQKCPVCDYEFTITSLPEHPVYDAIIPVGQGTVTVIETGDPHRRLFALKSPRAPPILKFS